MRGGTSEEGLFARKMVQLDESVGKAVFYGLFKNCELSKLQEKEEVIGTNRFVNC